MNEWHGIPVKTSRWRITILRLLFPHRTHLQLGQSIYLLRVPAAPTPNRDQ